MVIRLYYEELSEEAKDRSGARTDLGANLHQGTRGRVREIIAKKAEGKKRMSLGGKGGVEEGSANLQQLGKVNEIIAKKSGMSARNVAYLIAVYRNRLDLFERVFDGTMSINKAYTQMKADEEPEVGIRLPD